MEKILIVQTAFIGDVILATPLIEKLHTHFPESKIDFLLRKGNEALLSNFPGIDEILVWNKKEEKYKNLFRMIKKIRAKKYDLVINLQRFTSTGLLTALSNADITIGFNKNPFSSFFSRKIKHDITFGSHEVERNHMLVRDFTDADVGKPKLYFSDEDVQVVEKLNLEKTYICIAPASVWFTKQFPLNKWEEFLQALPTEIKIFLLGAPSDLDMCNHLSTAFPSRDIGVLAGKLTLLQSALLMKNALMNYVNDSAPLHLASAVNAPTASIFCSTVPAFGFGPLSDRAVIIETEEKLDCRPCGLHGYKACPKGHFKCAQSINVEKMVTAISN